jgi:hypothetical protein
MLHLLLTFLPSISPPRACFALSSVALVGPSAWNEIFLPTYHTTQLTLQNPGSVSGALAETGQLCFYYVGHTSLMTPSSISLLL